LREPWLALSRVVIGQRERTIALMPTDGGLVAHTLDELRDINDAKQIFESIGDIAQRVRRLDKSMVAAPPPVVAPRIPTTSACRPRSQRTSQSECRWIPTTAPNRHCP
jgi:hypothetical protein